VFESFCFNFFLCEVLDKYCSLFSTYCFLSYSHDFLGGSDSVIKDYRNSIDFPYFGALHYQILTRINNK